MTLKFEIVKRSLDDPTFSESFIYFYDTRAPNSSDDDYINTIPFGTDFLVFWWDQSVNDLYQLTNWGNTQLVWQKLVTNLNILDIISTVGWQINTNRAYTQRTSPIFSTSYTPSTTNDTFVIASFGLSDTLLSPVSLTVAVGGVTIATVGLAGITATETGVISFQVPANSTYEFTVVSGSPTIVSVYELSQ